jgi:hypothetical protein
MRIIHLEKVKHNVKVGEKCPHIAPNVNEDSIFYVDGKAIGFFLKKMPEKATKLADLANQEFKSKNVPKTKMDRSDVLKAQLLDPTLTREQARQIGTSQMSTILGGVPAKPQFMRYYNTMSSVHSVPSAKMFVKAMYMLALESEKIVMEYLPEQYKNQLKIFESVDKRFKFGNIFTSSISNFNISAAYHRDTGNIQNTVNVIITKRKDSHGGNLSVPDYDITIEQSDGSMLVYPAWMNIHGVTPIVPIKEGGYRNSLIFYPLKAFIIKDKNEE